jgi:hypothetical protein
MACFFDPFKPNGANVAIRAVNPNFLKTKMDGLLLFNLPVARVLERCGDEAAKQGMGGHGPGFEFRMELASQKPGVIANLYDFHQFPRRSHAGDVESGFRSAATCRHC